MKSFIAVFIVLIVSCKCVGISSNNKQPRNLQKILQGFDQKGRFLEVEHELLENEAAANKENAKQDAFDNMLKKIYEYAEEIRKSLPPPDVRRIRAGVFSDIYPKDMRERAEENILKKREEAYDVRMLTKPYRFCLYPISKINALRYCEKFKKISLVRFDECRHLNCLNCCNHLLLIMKYVTGQSIVSEILGLNDDAGFNKIVTQVTPYVQKQCRIDCKKVYPMDEPIAVEPPPKDPELGTNDQDPALSCMDVMLNGGVPETGLYWIKTGNLNPYTVYCDMDGDSGGWTLFYNFVHKPGELFDIDAETLPTQPDKNKSYMNLDQLEFKGTDVMEIRFFCQTEHTFEDKPIYMHFKSRNPDVIKTAMTGDQFFLKPKSWSAKSTPLAITGPKYSDFFFSRAQMHVDDCNHNERGGFWDKPFFGEKGSWTIRGEDKQGQKYECGDNLEIITNGPVFGTFHQILFRGEGPDDAFIEERFLLKMERLES